MISLQLIGPSLRLAEINQTAALRLTHEGHLRLAIEAERWITLPNGTRVKIDDEGGITVGPPTLSGKDMDDLPKFADADFPGKDDGGPKKGKGDAGNDARPDNTSNPFNPTTIDNVKTHGEGLAGALSPKERHRLKGMPADERREATRKELEGDRNLADRVKKAGADHESESEREAYLDIASRAAADRLEKADNGGGKLAPAGKSKPATPIDAAADRVGGGYFDGGRGDADMDDLKNMSKSEFEDMVYTDARHAADQIGGNDHDADDGRIELVDGARKQENRRKVLDAAYQKFDQERKAYLGGTKGRDGDGDGKKDE